MGDNDKKPSQSAPRRPPRIPFSAAAFGAVSPRGDETSERKLSSVSGADGKSDSLDVSVLPKWSDFFDCHELVDLPASTRRRSGDTAGQPTSSEDSKDYDQFSVYTCKSQGPLVVFLHGAGHTALSWAQVARNLEGKCKIVAYDARGHGQTKCVDNSDLTFETLVDDAIRLIEVMMEKMRVEGEDKESSSKLVLVGHSMGGALATKIAHGGALPSLFGLVVLDVVEGTAMSALPQMINFVRRFPKSFTKVEDAIDWSIKTGILANAKSARISIPSQLVERGDGRWHWIIDLASTEPFWRGWFQGMSNMFVEAKCAKVLVLAGEDRLDKTMMIAQMQGKFQLVVIPKSGHVLEEDQPEQTANILWSFIKRHQLVACP